MTEIPRVSIITPSYNKGKYIEETIKSVISQEGDFYLEYLIMDGGSTDSSVEIIKEYEKLLKDGKWSVKCLGIEYIWVSEKDRGQSDAINKGFKRAKGEIVAWLNSDDTYQPDAIKTAVNYLLAHPDVMMVYGEGYEIDEQGRLLNKFMATQQFDLNFLIYAVNYILQPTVFMRKRALESVGYLDADLHFCMDWDLWIKISKLFKVGYVPVFLANARMYEDTKTSSGGLKRFKELAMLMRRHGNVRYPLGYFTYGYNILDIALLQRFPKFYSRFLKYITDFFAAKIIKASQTHYDTVLKNKKILK